MYDSNNPFFFQGCFFRGSSMCAEKHRIGIRCKNHQYQKIVGPRYEKNTAKMLHFARLWESVTQNFLIHFSISIKEFLSHLSADFQKLEREARICRKLQHPNIGERV